MHFFAHVVAPYYEFKRTPTPYLDEIKENFCKQADDFLQNISDREKKDYVVDSTPWNIEILDVLSERFPEAHFVISLRNYKGVVQSLRRSFDEGFKWAGPTDENRAKVWVKELSHLKNTSPEIIENATLFSYDSFCKNPHIAIDSLKDSFAKKGIPHDFDVNTLKRSYATKAPRKTIYSSNGELMPISSWKSSEKIDQKAHEIARETDQWLKSTYPNAYTDAIDLNKTL